MVGGFAFAYYWTWRYKTLYEQESAFCSGDTRDYNMSDFNDTILLDPPMAIFKRVGGETDWELYAN